MTATGWHLPWVILELEQQLLPETGTSRFELSMLVFMLWVKNCEVHNLSIIIFLQVNQFSCEFNNLAPQGCTQFFYGPTSNIVQSYNYNNGASVHLASQDQAICIRSVSHKSIIHNLQNYIYDYFLANRRERNMCRLVKITERFNCMLALNFMLISMRHSSGFAGAHRRMQTLLCQVK